MNILKSINNVKREENLQKFERFQSTLDFEINRDIKEILIGYNVAKPVRSFYKKENAEFDLNYLFGFSERAYEDFASNYETYSHRMPKEMFPIGNIDGGDLLCINKITGEVYYWFHEEDDWGLADNEKYPTKVGNNLNELLESLMESARSTKEEIERAKRGGGRKFISAIGLELLNKDRAKRGLPPLTMEEALANKK
ncbi:MAG: SMI1/KNR4 family protein [Clostridiales Family XIII bacterium]|jgi:hypothetical protein|nr:SMI1/KNR4 family protein [Clostridiales Family XIII bacterium]